MGGKYKGVRLEKILALEISKADEFDQYLRSNENTFFLRYVEDKGKLPEPSPLTFDHIKKILSRRLESFLFDKHWNDAWNELLAEREQPGDGCLDLLMLADEAKQPGDETFFAM